MRVKHIVYSPYDSILENSGICGICSCRIEWKYDMSFKQYRYREYGNMEWTAGIGECLGGKPKITITKEEDIYGRPRYKAAMSSIGVSGYGKTIGVSIDNLIHFTQTHYELV
jgi:hypothetical protein